MKKILGSIIAIGMSLSIVSSALAIEVVPTTSKLIVDNTEVNVSAYNIDGNNYFKLRDIAYVLNGTPSQFSVGYNSVLNSVILNSKQPYTAIGGEVEQGEQKMDDISESKQKVLKDGSEVEMQAYNIDGNNYYKLRDLGTKLNFGVDYDATTNSVIVQSAKPSDTPDDSLKRDADGFLIGDEPFHATPAPPVRTGLD